MTIHYPKSRKAVLFIGLLILLIVLGSSSAVYAYQHRAHVPEGLTLQEAVNQRDDALHALRIHDSVNAANERDYQTTIKDQNTVIATATTTTATLCSQIRAAKLKQPLCP